MKSVWLVDDDASIRFVLEKALKRAEFVTESFANGQDVLTALEYEQPSVLISDVRMPGMSGLELQDALKNRNIKIPIIFITGHGDIQMAVRAMKNEATEFLPKPVNNQILLEAINKALQKDSQRRETEEKTEA